VTAAPFYTHCGQRLNAIGTRSSYVRRLNAWALMKAFLPKVWRCPPDFVISEAADRRMEPYVSAEANDLALVRRIAVSERGLK
jgi:hypothetical protein